MQFQFLVKQMQFQFPRKGNLPHLLSASLGARLLHFLDVVTTQTVPQSQFCISENPLLQVRHGQAGQGLLSVHGPPPGMACGLREWSVDPCGSTHRTPCFSSEKSRGGAPAPSCPPGSRTLGTTLLHSWVGGATGRGGSGEEAS